MKKTDIQKIRQLLKQAQINMLQGGNYPIVYKNGYIAGIDKALALLPCETCGGTGQVAIPREDTPGFDWKSCPDCQS